MVDARIYEIDYQHQYRHWLKIKSQTDAIQHQLRKGFQVDDTAIAATYITRKLDDLETSIVSRQNLQNRTATISNQIKRENSSYNKTGKDGLLNSEFEKLKLEHDSKMMRDFLNLGRDRVDSKSNLPMSPMRTNNFNFNASNQEQICNLSKKLKNHKVKKKWVSIGRSATNRRAEILEQGLLGENVEPEITASNPIAVVLQRMKLKKFNKGMEKAQKNLDKEANWGGILRGLETRLFSESRA